MPAWRRFSLIPLCALLAATTLLAYWPVNDCGFLNFDDPLYVTANPHVRAGFAWPTVAWAFTSQVGGNWHPLTWLSHALDCQWFGLNPGRHHLVNLLIHTANALLLLLFLHRSTGSRWRSATVAALFALHPLHVESVAWIAERKDVLSLFFLLLTLLAYHAYTRRPSLRNYLPVLLFLALGLMSKAMLVSAPFLLLLLDYWPLARWPEREAADRRAIPWRLLGEKIPLLLLVLPVAGLTWWAQQRAGAMEALLALRLPTRIGNGLIATAAYLGQTFWPSELFLPYPYATELAPTMVIAAGLLLAALTYSAWRARRSQPYLLAGWLWFLVALLPVIGLVQVGVQARADRYTYLPHLGLFLALVWGGAKLAGSLRLDRRLLAATTGLMLLALGARSHRQLQYWHDSQQLFRHALAHRPDNYTAHTYLGLALAAENQLAEAAAEYASALRLRPQDSEALANLGVVLAKQGKWDAARQALEEAASRQPGNGKIKNNLGNLAKTRGELEEARAYYQAALALEGENREFLFNLANTLEKLGQPDAAIGYYQQALRLYPDFAEAHNGLGVALANRGERAAAARSFQAALLLRPDYRQATENLAWLRREGGKE